MEIYGSRKKNGSASHEAEGRTARPKRRGRRLVTALLVIVALAAAVVIGYTIWEKPPEVIGPDPQAAATPAVSPDVTDGPAVSDAPEDPLEEEDEFDGALVTERDDGVYTFLLVGRDHESNSTDTVIVGKFDTKNHTLDAVNIPRDTLINISWADTPKKINAVYPGYTNSGRSGIDGLRTHIRNLIGFDVDCYAVVNLKVVEDIINEIGGVYFDVPIDMDYDDGAQHFHVHLKSGYQKLNGYEALGVFRYRYGNNGNTYPGGDLERIGVQQNLMKSIASQMLTLGNIPNLGTVIQLCVDNVETNLSSANMAFFARQILKCSAESINFHTAPYSGTAFINEISYVSLDMNGWLEMVNSYLNPFKEAVTSANVNMLFSNYDGSNMYSNTGAIAGGPNSIMCGNYLCELFYSHHAPGAHVFKQTESGSVTGTAPETGETTEPTPETEEESGETPETGTAEPWTEQTAPEEGPEITEVIVP